MYGSAGQKRVPADFIENFPVPLPPLDEQRAIAAFLDAETAKLDAIVEKRRRLIELLHERLSRPPSAPSCKAPIITLSPTPWLTVTP
jgi:restriction endonuclease S subunit